MATDDLLSYEDAAKEIGIAVGSVKQAIQRDLLHPVRVPGQQRKFLRRGEVERYRDAKRARTRLTLLRGADGKSRRDEVRGGAAAAAARDSEALEVLRLVVAAIQAMRDTMVAGLAEYHALQASSRRHPTSAGLGGTPADPAGGALQASEMPGFDDLLAAVLGQSMRLPQTPAQNAPTPD